MIIKSWSGKHKNSFKKVIHYIFKNAEQEKTIKWNLETKENDIKKIIIEFKENSEYIRYRKNWNILYHETISFSGKDNVDSEVLLNLARKYLELRADNALAYWVIHKNTENPHAHFVISANNILSKRKLNLSIAQFARIKRQMEDYQKEKYPELENSIINHEKTLEVKEKKKLVAKRSRWEMEAKRRQLKSQQSEQGARSHKLTEKDRIAFLLKICLAEATNKQTLHDKLIEEGLELYQRWNTPWVKDIATGRKHRLTTLELLEIYTQVLERWELTAQRESDLEEIQVEKAKKIVKEIGFRYDIKDILKRGKDKFKILSGFSVERILKFRKILTFKRKHQIEQISKIFKR